jgi:RHS repeat-associated protein
VTAIYPYCNGLLLAKIQPGVQVQKYFYHHDGLGSIIGMTSGTVPPTVMQSYRYDEFGRLLQQGAPMGTQSNYRYTAQEYDGAVSALYNYRARYYDPELGRFTQEDPVLTRRLAGGRGLGSPDLLGRLKDNRNNPLGLNRYPYVSNNPINSTDPYGELECSYSIKDILLTCFTESGEIVTCDAISGNNNPDDQGKPNVGPIPMGIWDIGVPDTRKWAKLTPRTGTNTHGRGGFFIHGWGSSEGCIAVLYDSCRDRIMKELRCECGGTLEVKK